MGTEKDETITPEPSEFHPLDISVRENFVGVRYRTQLQEWDKASDRLLSDADGAITSARSLIETTCKTVLHDLGVEFPRGADLPKLFDLVANSLNMAPGGQSDPSLRTLFSATYQAMRAVSEIRNRHGDAHGKAKDAIPPAFADAEFVVHLAGALTCYIARRFESHLNVTRRLTSDGQAILRFDKSRVWRLVDHSTNSPKSGLWYGEDTGRCLFLVGDAGIYLMSNGDPQLMANGRIAKDEDAERKLVFTAEAEGCGPSTEFESWWPIHNAIDGGNDFALPMPVEEFREPLEAASNSIVIIATSEKYIIMSDTEFERYTDPTI